LDAKDTVAISDEEILALIKPSAQEVRTLAMTFDESDPRREQMLSILFLDDGWFDELSGGIA